MNFIFAIGALAILFMTCELAHGRRGEEGMTYDEVKAMMMAEKQPKQSNSEKVCYGDLGCFYSNGTMSYIGGIPESPEVVGTKFYLFADGSLNKNFTLTRNSTVLLTSSNFNPKHQTKFLVHGFSSSCHTKTNGPFKKALMEQGGYNIILVDWSYGARAPYYLKALLNMQVVAREIAVLINLISKTFNLPDFNSFHVIGHSLGSHIAGLVGERLIELNKKKLGRISALDPAGPLLQYKGIHVKLDKHDALFVDAIHTNGESILELGFGSSVMFGHVDFFPNGGKEQPGCDTPITAIVKGKDPICNHDRAIYYYIESLKNKCSFTSFKCSTGYSGFKKGDCFSCGKDGQECNSLGYFSKNFPALGAMFLDTRASSPFCGSQILLEVKTSPIQLPRYGKLIFTFYGKNNTRDQITFNRETKDDDFLGNTVYKRIHVVKPEVLNFKKLTIKFLHHFGAYRTMFTTIYVSKVTLTFPNGLKLNLGHRSWQGISGKEVELAQV